MSDPIKVALVSYEAVPFAKVGGLADVAGALPDALASCDVECRLILPKFGQIDPAEYGLEPVEVPDDWFVGIDFEHHPFRVWEGELPGGAGVWFVGDDRFYGRRGIYGDENGEPFGDELRRYVFFAKGALELLKCLDWRPDVIHANDHQTALIAPYVRDLYRDEERLRSAAVVYSIHNMAYQGVYPADDLPVVGFERARFEIMGPFELNGHLNLMKAGISYADRVNTVSPTYAAEIQTPEGGCGLDGVLRHVAHKVSGILNGIDESVWNPAADALIPHAFDAGDLDGKRGCKGALLARAGISLERLDLPLIGMVGRLVPQKGIDLVAAICHDLLKTDVSLIVLGSGAAQYEELFENLAVRYPDRVGACIGFDDELAHQITAGADIFLMPSRYEPCGLNQMYSMRYGTVPVVRRTGGLADTVQEWNADTGEGTGFVFEGQDAHALADALGRAISTFQDRDQWSRIIANGMARDFGWKASARRYRDLYETAINDRSAASAAAGDR